MADTTRDEIIEQLNSVTMRHFTQALSGGLETFATPQPQPNLTMADLQGTYEHLPYWHGQSSFFLLPPDFGQQAVDPAAPGSLGGFGFSGLRVIEDQNAPLGQMLFAGNLAISNPRTAFRLDNVGTPAPPEDPPTFLRKRVLRGK